MAIDPVCGMSVDENAAPARVEYQGRTYYFCSTECKAKFEREPHNYVRQEQPHSATR